MIFPVWPQHQERIAQQLKQSLGERGAALVHLFAFPHHDQSRNVLYGSAESEQNMEFEPTTQHPRSPVKLIYDRA